jgi:hypothetical protein
VATEQGGAWQRNRDTGQSLGKKNKIAGRGQLQWNPAEGINFRLDLHLSQDKSEETGLHLLKAYTPYNAGAGGPTIPADTSRYATGWRLDPVFAKIIGIDAASKPGVDNSNNGVDLTANIDFGGAKLTSITAYNKMIRREYSDWDATQYYDSDEYFRSNLDVFSQELRIASTGPGPLGWVLFRLHRREHRLSRGHHASDSADKIWPEGKFLRRIRPGQLSVQRRAQGNARRARRP